jgi:aryl-alcohol dehydrogenase-like predicted oxidoreductase
LAQPSVSTVIIGAKTPEQLRDNLAAAEVVLDEGELATLHEVGKLPAEYPGWMIALQGGYRANPPKHP